MQRFLALALALTGCAADAHDADSTGALSFPKCVRGGNEAGINAALNGPGASAILCPDATYSLFHTVQFTAPNQRIFTYGLPTDEHRARLLIMDSSITTAISGVDQSGITIENIEVDGDRSGLGYQQGDALIYIGGNASGQTVQNVYAHDTRSWSTLHLFEGNIVNDVPTCQSATIANNSIGPAGNPDPTLGQWADGISLACGSSNVYGNTITDATDGAIVIFGAPGSSIHDNTISAATQQLLGAINMVDYAPTNGNFDGTSVLNNTIIGNAFIKVAVAMGPPVWTCGSGVNHGASVADNTITGLNVGYGFTVNGVSNWQVLHNVDSAMHIGRAAATCAGTPSLPGAFQVQSASNSVLQPEFQPAQLTSVLGVSSCTLLAPGLSLQKNQWLDSCDGRFRLLLQADGNLVLYQGATPLWATNTVGRTSAQAVMQQDGNFVLYDASGAQVWASNTAQHPGAYLWVQNDGNLVVYAANKTPLWTSNTCCH